MSACLHTHARARAQMQILTHQLAFAIKSQKDLFYFTHPQGVNNSLEPRKGRGSWGRWRGGRWVVWLWAVHLRIAACHCAQRSWWRIMTSLAAFHKTCQGIAKPEMGYYVQFAGLILLWHFLALWNFYSSPYCFFIYYLFIGCHEPASHWCSL